MSDRDDALAEIERLFERMGQEFNGARFAQPPSVAVDVVETAGDVVVRADLPGYDIDDIAVTVDDRSLSLSATRTTELAVEDGAYRRQEREHDTVSRRLQLPVPVDEEAATATYDDGVLTVRLPAIDVADEGYTIDVE